MAFMRIINTETGEDLGTYEANSDLEALRKLAEAKGWKAPGGGDAQFAEKAGGDGEFLVLIEDDTR